jgi:hypothetical protein
MARRRMCALAAAVAASAFATLAFPAGAGAAAKPRLKLLLPSPGHITIDSTAVTVRRSSRDRPRNLRIRAPGAKALPSSVRVLWATRVIPRKRTVTYATLMLAINKASRTASGAQDGDFDPDLGGEIPPEYLLFFGIPGMSPDDFKAIVNPNHQAAVNAGNVPRRRLTDLFDGVKKNWRDGQLSVFDPRPQPGVESQIETGHYDDAHAFGWKPRRQDDAWNALTTSLSARANMDEVIAEIENNLGVDVDADGDKGAPKCQQGNFTTPPTTIVVPPQDRLETVRLATPIPNAAYYVPKNGYAGGGGCDRLNGKLIANVDVLGDGTPVAWRYDDVFGEQDDLHDGSYCPIPMGEGVSNRCTIRAPSLFLPPGDATKHRTLTLNVSFQNRFADQGGTSHQISVRVAWRPR